MSARTVAFVVPTMTFGGAERQVYLLVKHLDRAAWRPILVTLNGRGPYFDPAIESGAEAVCLDIHGKFPVRGLAALTRLLRDRKADVVVTRGFNATTLGRLAARRAGVPVSVVAEHAAGWIGRPGRLRGVTDAALMSSTAAFVAVAESQRPFLEGEKRIPSERIRVIHNGIEPMCAAEGARAAARARLGLEQDAFVVGIVAVLRPEKDHATFLRAAARLSEDLPSARFVVIGDGETRSALESLAEELGVASVVAFLGGRDDVPALLPALDVFALSSVTEAAPLSVLEAMSCGLPVVATSVGGLPETVRDDVDGLLVPPRDPGALAAAWLRLAQDQALRSSMGRRASARVAAEFSADVMAARHAELFETLLSEARR